MPNSEWQWYATWAGVCAVGLVISFAAEHRSQAALCAVGKLLAATAYIAATCSLGATDSDYGRILLAAMAFSWMGDLLLNAGSLYMCITCRFSHYLCHLLSKTLRIDQNFLPLYKNSKEPPIQSPWTN